MRREPFPYQSREGSRSRSAVEKRVFRGPAPGSKNPGRKDEAPDTRRRTLSPRGPNVRLHGSCPGAVGVDERQPHLALTAHRESLASILFGFRWPGRSASGRWSSYPCRARTRTAGFRTTRLREPRVPRVSTASTDVPYPASAPSVLRDSRGLGRLSVTV